MSNFDLSNLAIQSIASNNVLLYDDTGKPSVMVRIPKLTYAQLGMGESTAIHPAFIVNGQEVDEIYISKYQNVVENSRAYSLPGCAPRTNITFDAARQACGAKGDGWHVMTRMEWGLLLRWCQNNGVLPLGNNNYGKHASETSYKAVPATKDDTHYAVKTMTGTGPLTWNHDQSAAGIADLCGNVWEWVGGIRSVYGELQILANNNAADPANSQGVSSVEWKAIKGSDGTLIEPDGSGTTSGSIKMDCQSGKLVYSTSKSGDTGSGTSTYSSCTFGNMSCDQTVGSDAKLLLANLGLLMYNGATELFSSHLCYWDNTQEECFFYSGGGYYHSSFGVASFTCNYPRSFSYGTYGFRSAYLSIPD